MRGKLRDKRPTTKRDFVKREVLERRRPAKRDSRSSWLYQQSLEDDELEFELDEEEEAEDVKEENSSPKK
jgi:hypothetical protein